MIYNELIERGTADFPVSIYQVDKNHPRYEMPSHWHGDIELIRVTKGKMNIRLNNNEYVASAGDIIFVNPETIHGASPAIGCSYECVVLNFDVLKTAESSCRFFIDNLLNHEIRINEYIPKNQVGDFEKQVNRLFDALIDKKEGYKFNEISSLYAIMGEVVEG